MTSVTTPVPASGDLLTVAHGRLEASITKVGATLRALTVDGRDVVDGFGTGERSTDGRGQVLAPWPNRLTDGRYRYGGHDCQAALDEPDRHDAIHGLVRWLAWSTVAHDATSVSLRCALHPQPGYEWRLDLRITYSVTGDGLTVTLVATNSGTRRAPFGAGFHPYLTLAVDPVDTLLLSIPATTARRPSPLGGAAEMAAIEGTPQDFRQARRIGSTTLDTCFGGLVRRNDGTAVARLATPDGGEAAELWVDAAFGYLMVYTADDVERGARRRASVAIEPMSCPPDAFRTGTDVVELNPGASWRGVWGIRPILGTGRS